MPVLPYRSSTPSDLDGDSDLPPAFAVQDSKNCPHQVDDIVWVKYRKLYWPAVICKVYEKKKKLTVLYVDTPEKCSRARISITRAKPYYFFKNSQLQETIPATYTDSWNYAVDQVEKYLCKRATYGKVISPIKYFQCPYSYACASSEDLKCDSSKESNYADSPVVPEKRTLNYYSEEYNDGREEKQIRNTVELEEHQRFTDSIITFLKSDDCKTYLLQVLSAKIDSDRHKKFFSPISSVRRQLIWKSGFGPIEDSSQINEVCTYLTHMLKNAGIPPHFDITSYAFDVWIPEAVIWALTKVLDVSSNEAEAYFLRGADGTVKRHDEKV